MGLYDRDYMRGNSERSNRFGHFGGFGSLYQSNAAVKILILINVAVFILGAFVERLTNSATFYLWFELSPHALAAGKIWTLVTYSFLHANLLHIALNMIGLYFMGTPLVKMIGSRKFLLIYFSGAIVGGILWLLTSLGVSSAGLVGASAAVMAVFAAFCCFYPPLPLTFLIFFVIPVSMKPMTMLKMAAAFEVLGFLYALMGGESSIAYAAHLGGICAGIALSAMIKGGRLEFFEKISMPKFGAKTQTSPLKSSRSATDYSYKVNITDPVELKREVDRILDKINRGGFASLTDAERDTLRKAKSYLK